MRKAGSARKRPAAKSRKRTAAKRRSASPKRSKQSPVARVKRVTREVVQQASTAVSAGVETLRDLGENIVDRVRSN
jgi:hypothetical protein